MFSLAALRCGLGGRVNWSAFKWDVCLRGAALALLVALMHVAHKKVPAKVGCRGGSGGAAGSRACAGRWRQAAGPLTAYRPAPANAPTLLQLIGAWAGGGAWYREPHLRSLDVSPADQLRLCVAIQLEGGPQLLRTACELGVELGGSLQPRRPPLGLAAALLPHSHPLRREARAQAFVPLEALERARRVFGRL